jgi:imidazoleglycerol phosphate synthase glutamine amidotransferase subunit HisH
VHNIRNKKKYYIYLNFKLSNQKAQFVALEHEINALSGLTSSISEPAFFLTMFHPNNSNNTPAQAVTLA